MYLINGKRPENGDKFYNTVKNGGYSQCIQGKPVVKGLNVLCNCVGAACGFFNKIYSEVTGFKGMKYPKFYCDAEGFINQAKKYYPELEIVDEPVEGGIMVWEGLGKKAGHVAGVVKCNSATQVYTIESGYNSFAWANYTRNKGDNGNYGLSTSKYKYLGCIVNPALGKQRSYEEVKPDPIPDPKPIPTPAPTKKEISLGDTVIVNGVGTASSTGEGARTRRYVNQKMKVIMISGNTSRPNRYALNQYNKGNVNEPFAVTGWFSINDIKK